MSGFQIEKLKMLEHIHITTILGQQMTKTILGQQITRREESEYVDDVFDPYDYLDEFYSPQLQPSRIEPEYFLVSVLEQGETLLDYARRTDPEYFKEETFANLFWGTAKGLNYLHENQIIHCNLNAANVFVRRMPGSNQVTMFTIINLITENRKLLGSISYIIRFMLHSEYFTQMIKSSQIQNKQAGVAFLLLSLKFYAFDFHN